MNGHTALDEFKKTRRNAKDVKHPFNSIKLQKPPKPKNVPSEVKPRPKPDTVPRTPMGKVNLINKKEYQNINKKTKKDHFGTLF